MIVRCSALSVPALEPGLPSNAANGLLAGAGGWSCAACGWLGGAGRAFGNAWYLIAAAIAALLVTVLAIRREEAHLAYRFGPAWDAYARRTPRWLRLRR